MHPIRLLLLSRGRGTLDTGKTTAEPMQLLRDHDAEVGDPALQ